MRCIPFLLLTVLCACSCSNGFKVGETRFVLYDNAEPWDDLPEVMRRMQKIGPPELWKTVVHLYPGYQELTLQKAICLYQPTNQEIHARTALESAYQGCLPHEFAHRWVDLKNLDDECEEEDTHNCPGFQETFLRLKTTACVGAWKFEGECLDVETSTTN